jgi:hypothetical protein
MAKGQQRKNKEANKPKKQKQPAVQAIFCPTDRAEV